MPPLCIGSRGAQFALLQANLISALFRARGQELTRTARTIMGRFFSRFEWIRRDWSRDGSTLVLLKWGFGEYYQCGYWAALENRGSWLFAAARGSNPLLSAALRDPRDLRTCLTGEWFLTNRSSDATLKLVLKRGTAPFLGGLTSRLSLLPNILPGVARHV
jgi:hypothetical protein